MPKNLFISITLLLIALGMSFCTLCLDYPAHEIYEKTTNSHFANFDKALNVYKEEFGRYPDSLTQLQPRFLSRIPKDPWGNAYQYQAQNDGAHYIIFSLGEDSIQGGEYENADHFFNSVIK